MRADLDIVARMVGNDVRVIDLGCGDGTLLQHLIERQGCGGLGVESDTDYFHSCIERGVPVTHGDLEAEVTEIDDGAFDVAVLSLTIQGVKRPDHVLAEMRRIAPRLVVSFENLGHWRRRATLALRGRKPAGNAPEQRWYDTPKIHPCTIIDFELLAADLGLTITERVLTKDDGRKAPTPAGLAANLLAESVVYSLRG